MNYKNNFRRSYGVSQPSRILTEGNHKREDALYITFEDITSKTDIEEVKNELQSVFDRVFPSIKADNVVEERFRMAQLILNALNKRKKCSTVGQISEYVRHSRLSLNKTYPSQLDVLQATVKLVNKGKLKQFKQGTLLYLGLPEWFYPNGGVKEDFSEKASSEEIKEFSCGDIVVEKKTDTIMSVKSVDGDKVVCNWFDDKSEVHEEEFSSNDLLLCEGNEGKKARY